jgi:transcriptional regulator with GAF, ATPase, and Fis domain
MPYVTVKESGSERNQPLTEAEILIGRSRQNHIKLATEQASRQHCRLLRTERTYRLIDGGSSNGTYVNGQRVGEKDLAEGDAISVGNAVVVFHEGEPSRPAFKLPDPANFQLPIDDRNVKILLRTIISAASSENLDGFLHAAMDNVIEIAQAERGILFTRAGDGELTAMVARDSAKKELPELIGISRTIPKQVYDTKKPIFLLDTESEKDSVQSASVSLYHLRTIMCAPLRVGEKMLGVLYVDNHAKVREYSQTDLAIFEAVTNYLSLTMENLRSAQEAKAREEARRKALEHENAVMRTALEARRHLIGECAAMKSVYENLRKVAPTDATVLVLGESGTGKEAIANVLHDLSPRSEKPFVVIDCAAIPETLLESELFGYEKGAFTGANAQKQGKFEMAQGGTLFLDEMGELSLNLQVKLLRALEQRSVSRVGGTEPIPIDIRLVAATNRNLEEMVKLNKFRQDLYFRLKVVTVTLPPLRERGEDILLLADFFLAEANTTNVRTVKGYSEEARNAMRAHRWEGNIRELKHRIEQAVILSNNQFLSTEDLNLVAAEKSFQSLEHARDHFEKVYVVQALARNGFNVTRTAREIDLSRQHLQNLIKKHGITRFTDSDESSPGA